MLHLHLNERRSAAANCAPLLPGLHSLRNVNHSGPSAELSRFLSGRRILRVIQAIAAHPTPSTGVPARCCCVLFPTILSRLQVCYSSF